MRVVYTEEAAADLAEAVEYLHARSPPAAERLADEIFQAVARLAVHELEGPATKLQSGARVRSWPVYPFRVYYQRHSSEFLVVRIYHQARRPLERRRRRPGH